MKSRCSAFILSFIFGCCLGCRVSHSYINNDGKAIYSTNASRPFKYGYAYGKEEARFKYESLISDLELKNGEVIADVGAASGWLEGVFSLFLDSITFYVEDIDSNYANEVEMGKVVSHYSSVRGAPQTNSFHFVLGNPKSTNLPDTAFDKVLLINSFHEMKNIHEMISDLISKLKPGGKLMISEGFSNEFKVRHLPGCGISGYTTMFIVQMMSFHGLYLTGISGPMNSFYNCLTFQKDQELSKEFFNRMDKVNPQIKILDQLNLRTFAKDSSKTKEIGDYLQANTATINTVYKTLEDYLSSLGNEWSEAQRYTEAINVLKVNAQLYPNSPFVYDQLGEVYLKDRQYENAIANFSKSYSMNAANVNAREKLDKIKSLKPGLFKQMTIAN